MSNKTMTLEEKLNAYFSGKVHELPKATARNVPDEYKSTNQRVQESIARKLGLAGQAERTGAKYYDKPIKELLALEKDARNKLVDTEDELYDFLEDQKKNFISDLKKNRYLFLSDEDRAQRAEKYISEIFIHWGGRYLSDQEREARKQYQALLDKFEECNTEYNSILLAKQNYMTENADLIEAERNAKRIRELKESGLLEELDLVEKKSEEEIENESNI